MTYALVYQGGIANVFRCDWNPRTSNPFERGAVRLLQGTFEECYWYCRGISQAGHSVVTMACDQAGDITNAEWTTDLENQPFAERLRKVTK